MLAVQHIDIEAELRSDRIRPVPPFIGQGYIQANFLLWFYIQRSENTLKHRIAQNIFVFPLFSSSAFLCLGAFTHRQADNR